MAGPRPLPALAVLLWVLALAGCAAPVAAGHDPLVEGAPRAAQLPDCPVYLQEPIPPAEDGWWVDVAVEVEEHAACAVDREGGLTCFGSPEAAAGFQDDWPGIPLRSIAIGKDACGVSLDGGHLVCWEPGGGDLKVFPSPTGVPFTSVVSSYVRPNASNWGALGDMCWVVDALGLVLDCSLPLLGQETVYDSVHRLHPAAEGDAPVGTTRAGVCSFDYDNGFCIDNAIDIDQLQRTDRVAHEWKEVFLVDCFIDRAYRPHCMVPDASALYDGVYLEPEDVWSPSPCRWQGLELVEDPDLDDGYSPALIGYRFDGTVEVYNPSVVAGPALETLLPDGTYWKVDGHPSVVGCAITLEGELRCWDRDGILDQEVPGVP